MLISEFAKVTDMPVDTVRFYVRKGLLKPGRGTKGGSKSYQIFSDVDVTTANMIRLQQSLGYSLREIAALNKEYSKGANSLIRTADALKVQISRLEEKKAKIDSALSFLYGKLEWVQAGKPGDAPHLKDYYCG